MRRSKSLGLSLVLLALSGCEDDATRLAREAAQKKAEEAQKLAQLAESQADDAKNFATVMEAVGRARVLAWGDVATEKRLEDAADRARKARDGLLLQAWQKAESQGKAALDEADPEKAVKACTEALTSLDRLAPAVLQKQSKEVETLRRQVVERTTCAKRTIEILAKAKELKEADAPGRARALLASVEGIDTYKQSPFARRFASAKAEIPEGATGAGPTDAADWITVFDGSDDKQIKYFNQQHDWTWKVEDNVLLGDNTESNDETTIWLGDKGWSNLLVEFVFNLGDGAGITFRTRVQTDDQGDETSAEKIELTSQMFQKGIDYTIKVELKGNKATWQRLDTLEKQTVELQADKGKIGWTLPGMTSIKIKRIKLRLLDKDAVKPEIRVTAKPKVDEPVDPASKKKKKKKKPGDAPEDEKKDGEKKPADAPDDKKDGEKKDPEKKD